MDYSRLLIKMSERQFALSFQSRTLFRKGANISDRFVSLENISISPLSNQSGSYMPVLNAYGCTGLSRRFAENESTDFGMVRTEQNFIRKTNIHWCHLQKYLMR